MFTEIYFVYFNGWSGQIYFAEWLPTLYNSLWTSLTCLFAFAFESDVHFPEVVYSNTKIYKAGQKNKYFNIKIFWKWVLLAVVHGFIIFWMCKSLEGPIDPSGKTTDHWYISSVAFTCVIYLVTWKLILETINLNSIYIIVVIISLISYWVIVLLLNTNGIARVMQP